MQTTDFFFEKTLSSMSEQRISVLFYGLPLYIMWGLLALANIGCTCNQEWNEQPTAWNVLCLHFAKKYIFSSMNMNYKQKHEIIQTPLTPQVAFGWWPSLKPHPAWREGEVPFCIILCCCRQKILSRGTYSEDLELSFLEQRQAYK